MPSPPRALVDANIIFSNHLRNLLLQPAANDAFEVHWSAEIEQEWLRNMEDRTRDRIRTHTLPLIRQYFPNAIVAGFDPDLETGKTDAKDRHVAGAARHIAPCYLVTENLRHFDAEMLGHHGVLVRNADDFLAELADANPAVIRDAVEDACSNLKKTKPSFEEYLNLLSERCGLKKFVERPRKPGSNAEPPTDHDLTWPKPAPTPALRPLPTAAMLCFHSRKYIGAVRKNYGSSHTLV